jgi:hypothetical protein
MMADGASLNVPGLLAHPADMKAPQVADAKAAITRLPEPQRLALAIEIVLGATETSSRLQLRRLITAANRVSLELGAKALERGEL